MLLQAEFALDFIVEHIKGKNQNLQVWIAKTKKNKTL